MQQKWLLKHQDLVFLYWPEIKPSYIWWESGLLVWLAYLFGRDVFIATRFFSDPISSDLRVLGPGSQVLIFLGRRSQSSGCWVSGPFPSSPDFKVFLCIAVSFNILACSCFSPVKFWNHLSLQGPNFFKNFFIKLVFWVLLFYWKSFSKCFYLLH